MTALPSAGRCSLLTACASFTRTLLLCSTLVAGVALPAAAQNSVTGRWLGSVGWGDSSSSTNPRQNAVHMSLLRGPRDSTFVLWWASGASAQLYTWNPKDYADPSNLHFTHIHVPDTLTQIFCAGHHTLADGRLLVVGGMDGPKLSDLGTDHADIFDPATKKWTPAAHLNVGRYYPSLTMLGNGNIVATAGNRYYPMAVFGGRGGAAKAPNGELQPLALARNLNFDPGASDPSTARYRHSAVYDAGRIRTVIYGGLDASGNTLGDLISSTRDGLDTGERWRINRLYPLPDPVAGSPAPRSGHSAVVVPSGDTMYVYGGRGADGAALGDTWRLILWSNPERWERVYPMGAGPGPRYGHMGVYDPGPPDVASSYPVDALETALFWIGHARELGMNEALPNLVGPNKRMVIFGGLTDSTRLAGRQAWALSLAGPLRWIPVADSVTGPEPRAWFGGAFDKVQRSYEVYSTVVHQRRLLLFGGKAAGGLKNDMWALVRGDDSRGDTTYSWQALTYPGAPPPRFGHSVIADDEWDRLVVFGGDTSLALEGQGTSDLWAADFSGVVGWTHLPTTNTPTPRTGHSADYHFLSVIAIAPEIYSPSYNRWTLMNTTLQMDNYPAMFLLPSGNLFFATRWHEDNSANPMLNMRSGTWSYSPFVSHFPLGTAVEYEPGKILKVAGNSSSGGVALDSTAYIEFGAGDSSAGWIPASFAPGQRVESRNQHNLTVLPTGQVLVTGGEGINDDPAEARKEAQIWDPATHLWSAPLAAEDMIRTYHSCAVLLPDGRVLSAGGSAWPDLNYVSIYEPPYLFKGDRLVSQPIIDTVKTSVAYRERFKIYTDTDRIKGPKSRIVLIRPSSVTHGFNEEQRYIRLQYLNCQNGEFLATAPIDSNTAPPGNYMLFVVDSSGVPSLAKWISVGLITQPTQPQTGLPCDDLVGTPSPGPAGLRFALEANRPNPFARSTSIRYVLPSRLAVKLEIFDVRGRRIRVLADAVQDAGRYSVTWDRRASSGNLSAAGVYFCRLSAGPNQAERKMLILH